MNMKEVRSNLQKATPEQLLEYAVNLNKVYRHMVATGQTVLLPGPARALQDSIDKAKAIQRLQRMRGL